MKLQKVRYEDLNSKAQEMYNFQKVAAKLADYGFTCIWLSNDWQGADFIAVHADGLTDIKVQLKGRLSFAQKYIGKNIYVCFMEGQDTYLYPHDAILTEVAEKISDKTWQEKGRWSAPKLSSEFRRLLTPHRL